MLSHIKCLLLLALSWGLTTMALAAMPSFTVSASDVTVSQGAAGVIGSIPTTVRSIDGYVGAGFIECLGTTAPSGARVPYCASRPPSYTVAANASATESVYLTADPEPSQASLMHHHQSQIAGLMLAGGFVVSFLFPMRRRAKWSGLFVFTTTLIGLVCTSGCGSNIQSLTPGTYTYTLEAVDAVSHVSVTTTAKVIVP